MNLNQIKRIMLYTVFLTGNVYAASAEIYNDEIITVTQSDVINGLNYSADTINPIEGTNKDGIKTYINNMPISFSDNITLRLSDKGCFTSKVEIFSFNKDKQIEKDEVIFKRNENPEPLSLSYCFFGSNSAPDYVTKFEKNIFFINSYGVSYYNINKKQKINLPITLNNKEQKESIIYTTIYRNKLVVIIENINNKKNYYQISTKNN